MGALLLSVGLLIVGEGINILAELQSARLAGGVASLFEPKNLFLFGMVVVGCSFLLAGYVTGYSVAKNIWVVTASSIGAILIVEPILAWTFFHQLPEKGALMGLVLGAIGLIATIAWR